MLVPARPCTPSIKSTNYAAKLLHLLTNLLLLTSDRNPLSAYLTCVAEMSKPEASAPILTKSPRGLIWPSQSGWKRAPARGGAGSVCVGLGEGVGRGEHAEQGAGWVWGGGGETGAGKVREGGSSAGREGSKWDVGGV